MSKHAPGPWKITHSEVNGYRVSDSTGWGVAVVLKDVNDEANAHLIAAAPQMLEALERLRGWVVAEAEQFGAVLPDDDIMEQATAAIRAAKGEV